MAVVFTTPTWRSTARRHQMRNRWMETEPQSDRCQISFPMDVRVEDDTFVISAFLPGVRVEDVDIQTVNETLTIQGEIKPDQPENARYLLQERPFGRFCRSITLPDALDINQAAADLTNGVLTVRIPKSMQARPRTISITHNNN